MLGHDLLAECARHLADVLWADADDDDDDDPADANAKAGSCAATCRSLLHATLGSGAARLRLELGAADIPWCV